MHAYNEPILSIQFITAGILASWHSDVLSTQKFYIPHKCYPIKAYQKNNNINT